jgi:ParB-like chromosome segregation protein Spo0J
MKSAETIENIPLSEIGEFGDNPRTISVEARERLRQSLDRFGLYRPLVVWRNPQGRPIIVAGHQRLALLRESMTPDSAVPCVSIDVDQATARVVALRDNNEDGEWEWGALGTFLSSLRDLADEDVDWRLTGFDQETIDGLLALADEPLHDPAPPIVEAPRLPAPEREPVREEVREEVEEQAERAEEIEYPARRFTKVSIGSLRGNIPNETYARFVRVWTAYSERMGSTDVSVVVAEIASVLLRRFGGGPAR